MGGEGQRIGSAVLSHDVGHLLSGALLVLSFALLYQRRVMAAINTFALQGLAVALAALWQGWMQAAPLLYMAGAVALVAKVIAIPIGLRAMVRRLDISRTIETTLDVLPAMALGAGLAVLAIFAARSALLRQGMMTREDLALTLSVVLLGLLMMITWRDAPAQVIGLMSLENGVVLAATGIVGMPLLVELSVAFLVMIAAIVSCIFFFRIREGFDTLDSYGLDAPGGPDR